MPISKHHPFGGQVGKWVKRNCITYVMSVMISVTALSLMVFPVQANISIEPLFIDLGVDAKSGGRPQGVITVANHGDEPAYIAVSLEEVVNPKADNETSITHKDPRAAGVLVSPARLIVEPGQKKRLRVVNIESPDRDRFFKVKVVPQAGPVEVEQGIGVKVLVGYSAWVFTRPLGSTPAVSGVREGRQLTLTNSGTTHTQLIQGRFCASDATPTGDCEKLPSQRLFVGRPLVLELPDAAGIVTFKDSKQDRLFKF